MTTLPHASFRLEMAQDAIQAGISMILPFSLSVLCSVMIASMTDWGVIEWGAYVTLLVTAATSIITAIVAGVLRIVSVVRAAERNVSHQIQGVATKALDVAKNASLDTEAVAAQVNQALDSSSLPTTPEQLRAFARQVAFETLAAQNAARADQEKP